MMTLYMVFEALRDRRLSLETLVPISPRAAAMVPSKLGLTPGTRLTVLQAILGLVTKSANDAAAAVGELLGGDEERFAQIMTLRARALGMSRTSFRNASGLPDPGQVSTARDLAVLARHLVRDFPEEYHFFSVPSFLYHARLIPNHDHLLQSYPGADGIKTGFTEAAGFNLVTSALRGEVRLIGVVLGAARAGERDLHMASLLDEGFAQMGAPAVGRQDWAARAGSFAAAQAAAASVSEAPEIAPIQTRAAAWVAHWGLQTGAFPSESGARFAAGLARHGADIGELRIEPAGSRRHPLYRAVLSGLTQAEARNACAVLLRRHLACVPLRPEIGQLARS
jgi:D-alanyl-D-alanine carboxypeptidase